MGKLENKICVITGAARGIGESIAEAFVDEGATVVITDKEARLGKAVAERLSCDFVRLEVSCENDWDKFAEIYPRINVLVNNAGITGFEERMVPHDPENTSLEDWQNRAFLRHSP